MKDINLRIRQGTEEWDLGSADADVADADQPGHVFWTITLPKDLKPGRATLIADDSEPLRVQVVAR